MGNALDISRESSAAETTKSSGEAQPGREVPSSMDSCGLNTLASSTFLSPLRRGRDGSSSWI